jgi:RNA polymerase sigma-70 factor, ECF subfamily
MRDDRSSDAQDIQPGQQSAAHALGPLADAQGPGATMPSPDGEPGAAGDDTALADARLLAALRAGDEAAFLQMVDRYHASLLRLALMYVSNRQVAEEVVQETWLAVLLGLKQFEGRSALKTWIVRILLNKAKTRAQREGRSVPFSSLPALDLESDEPSVEPERFYSADHPQWPGNWAAPPHTWESVPEQRLLARETRRRLREAIAALPAQQQEVILLRDIEGWTAAEVCNTLALSETNQRVLLHRARSKVRRALERYLDEE